MRIDRIRNFCIIAHIDHGKSTLADRLLLLTGAISQRGFRDQILDDMDLERERGITIKSSAVNIRTTLGGEEYSLNLIDTPGHVDFSYEVSRSLVACEGVLLLVDASQGVEAQTVANAWQAINHELTIIPVITKIDLASAQPEEVIEQMVHLLGVSAEEVLAVSSKTGEGVEEVLPAVIARVPAPSGREDAPARALIFDSVFDEYRGVITYVRMVDGRLRPGDRIRMLRTRTEYEVTELGCLRPERCELDELLAGEVGYLVASIKDLADVKIGDTVTLAATPDVEPLRGYRDPQPMVFCGFFPADGYDVNDLRKALEKLALNDCSFTFEPETSDALAFGFRCGFLGLLHMEIIQERLEREGSVALVQTAPSVTYEIKTNAGDVLHVRSPSDVPPAGEVEEMRKRKRITIVPSRFENFANTVVEAMAAGCPVVVSSAGGSTEIIENGRNGLVFETGDPRDLAARIRQLLDDPALALSLGEQARRDVRQRYDPALIGRQIVDYYREVIDKPDAAKAG